MQRWSPRLDQDDSIHLRALERCQLLLLQLRSLLVSKQHHREAADASFGLNRTSVSAERHIADMQKQHTESLSSADSQTARQSIWLISQLGNCDLDPFSSLGTKRPATSHAP